MSTTKIVSRASGVGVLGLGLLAVAVTAAGCATAPAAPTAEAAASAETDVSGAETPAGKRNVILFLGDGMGISTITAARILAGQREGQPGEDHSLSFERFPNVALVKTYNVDAQVPDSAGTMSAIMTGEKTRIGHISVGPEAMHGDCAAALDHELPTLLEMAEQEDMATGVVSTTRITHATPAAAYSHVPNRDWESDTELTDAARQAGCRDIARQLVEFDEGDGIEVVLGGGRAPFLPATAADPEYPDRTGGRSDDRDLIQQWQQRRPDGRFVWNSEQFEQLSAAEAGPVLGLFEPSHMQFEADRANDPGGEPSLAEMTAFAIDKLAADPDGFFLMVEAGRIDHGHHAGNAYRALEDTIALSEAVATALEKTNHSETLILVTADHSHTMTISGYPQRGNPILGKVVQPGGEPATDTEGRPYTTLGYQNGPGYRETVPDLTDVDTEAPNFRQVSAYPLESETHGGEDVAAFAVGPAGQWVRGVMEQNQLFDVMRRALLPGTVPEVDAEPAAR